MKPVMVANPSLRAVTARLSGTGAGMAIDAHPAWSVVTRLVSCRSTVTVSATPASGFPLRWSAMWISIDDPARRIGESCGFTLVTGRWAHRRNRPLAR